ncbi:MAG TPA: arsenic transporter [Terracidiphilus sp.]|jgi:arsenical pump membrane protein|nr:arsenic transporter [Terracidiphilus sp.]
MVFVWIVSLVSIVCMLLRPRKIGEAYWICGGALLLVVLRLIPLPQAAHAVYEGLDVYLFLTGMMVLAEMAREEHVFDWAAGVAAGHAKHSSLRLFVLVYGVGIVVTALLSNDATAVVLTPAVLAAVRRARVNPAPYLLACAFIANAASFVFPISNPANLVVFGRSLPPLLKWMDIFLLPSIASIAVTFLCLRWHARKELRQPIEGETAPAPLTTEGKLALAGLLLAAAALIAASAFGLPLGASTCCAAVFVLVVVAFRNPRIVASVAKGISWSVLPLVAGLFVIVEALENAGLLRAGLAGLKLLAHGPGWFAKGAPAFAVALVANGMNNLPVGLIGGSAIRHAQESGIVAHALLIGVDLGPNLSVTGSLATILWLIALRREKVEITAWEFLKVGMIAMPLALLGSLLVLRN